MRVGFIGLGNMGSPMARNLARAQFNVYGFDIQSSAPEGVRELGSSIEVAHRAEVLITMLPNSESLDAVTQVVLPELPNGMLWIDCSTVDIAQTEALSRKCSPRGIDFMDAPVSGSAEKAKAGTLTFMVGGHQRIIERAMPLLRVMGKEITHCGSVGAGQAAKICNNMILGATMIATCEAFVLADNLGLSRQKLFEVASKSTGYSWSMNEYCPAPGVGPKSPADNAYRAGFSVDLMTKDLKLSQDAARRVGIDTELVAKATVMYEEFLRSGGENQDFSAMLPHLISLVPEFERLKLETA